jgi:GAF domain-containing protein
MEGIVCSDNKRQLDDLDSRSGDEARIASRIVRHARALLAADEVSFWCVESDGQELAVRRTAVSEPAENAGAHPLQLSAEQCAGYFAATQATGLLISQDALHDDRIAGARESYLEPCNIQAVLSIAVLVDSQPIAIISCAQRGRHRHWSVSDVAVMQQLSAELAAEFGRRHKRQGWTARCRLLALRRVDRIETLNGWKGTP